jgi:glycosyltransferase involved in cell wall biosynthesis
MSMREGSPPTRICFTVDAAYAGGAERYVALIATGLDRRRFDPVVLAKRNPRLDAWCERLSAAGVRVERAPMDLRRRPCGAIGIWDAIRRVEPRVVHVNLPGPYDGQMGLLAPLARAAGAGAVVVTEHLPRVERLWKRALVKRASYAFVDRVITVCGANVDYLTGLQNVPEYKTDVVYNGIPESYGRRRAELRADARRFLGLRDSDIGIVFVGSLIERKGVGILIEALSGVAGGGWRLAVIGEGERRAGYEEKARAGRIEDKVNFLGEIGEEDVERVLCGSDLLVLPSFMEGMPYVVLEAMACSLAVVATAVDGIPEAVPDGQAGILVPPGDPAALRDALERVCRDAALRKSLGDTARRRFERRFTLQRHIATMETIYDTLAGA